MFRWPQVVLLLGVGAVAAVGCGHDEDVGRQPDASAGTGAQGGSSGKDAGQGGAGDSSLGGASHGDTCTEAAEAMNGEACVPNGFFSCGSQCCCGECLPTWQCTCDDGRWLCLVIDAFCDDQCGGSGGVGAGGESGGAGHGGAL